MKYLVKALSMLIAVLIVVVSCKTEIVTPIDIFALENGGYMRIVSGTTCVSSGSVSRKNMTGTNLTMLHEAVTPEKGAKFTVYDVEMRHVGATSTAWKAFRTINASEYKADATTGYPRHTFVVTGTEALTSTALDTSKVLKGSKFELRGTMKLSDGKSFNALNTGSNITGGSFYCSPFTYTMNVID